MTANTRKRALGLVAVLGVAMLAGCQSVSTRTEYTNRTQVLGAQQIGNFTPGTYRWVKLGLVAHAAAAPESEQGSRLGSIAMDRLVRKANLGPNQILVNVTVERGEATRGGARKSVVTIRADVIEIGTPPAATGSPRDLGEPEPKPAKTKKGGQ